MGNRRIDRASTLKTAPTFGAFHVMMISLGWGMGSSVAELISELDHWVAFGLLSTTGIHMIYEALHRGQSDPDPVIGIKSLLSFSVAMSIDTLIIGFSLPLLGIQLLLMVPLVGITSSPSPPLGGISGRG